MPRNPLQPAICEARIEFGQATDDAWQANKWYAEAISLSQWIGWSDASFCEENAKLGFCGHGPRHVSS